MFQVNKNNMLTLKIAPWWKRLLAYFIDQVLLLFISAVFGYLFFKDSLVADYTRITKLGGFNLGMQEHAFPPELIDHIAALSTFEQNLTYWFMISFEKHLPMFALISFILSSVYFILFWWSTGQTIGAKALKIKVISPLNFQIPITNVLIRACTLKLIEMAWGIPALFITNPLLRQRIHDSLSSTVVIEDLTEEEVELITKRLAEDENSTNDQESEEANID